jgi:hypothetical protein
MAQALIMLSCFMGNPFQAGRSPRKVPLYFYVDASIKNPLD